MHHNISILDTVGQYITLKRAGSDYQGQCPFHDDKNPSFTIYTRGNNYHCFGCGAHGDAITFEMEYNGLTYPEACKKLGVELDHKHEHHNHPPKQVAPKNPQKRLKEAKEEENKKRYIANALRQYHNAPISSNSDYLDKKQVRDVPCKYKGNGKHTFFLLTDVDGKELGLQRIDAEGNKKNIYGTNLKGACHIIEPDEGQKREPINAGHKPPIVICEGISTGLSLRKAIPHAKVYCALNAGNLPHVAKVVRQKHPEAEIKIACDNDESGTGLINGDEAAQKCKGTLLLPQEIGDDFNDVMVKHGISRVIDNLSIQGIKPLDYYIIRYYPKKTIDECISEYLKSFGKDYHFSKKSIESIRKRAIQLAGIKRWRSEKEIYEYYSGLENITVEELHDRYIPDNFTIEEGITVLSTPMGSGKTHLIKKDAEKHPNQRLMYIAPIRNLVKSSAEVLGFTHYQAENVYQAKKIATTVHSLYKFTKENEPIDTLYIDEIEQVLRVFTGKAIKYREKILDALRATIYQARRIVIADAFVTRETLDFLRTLRSQDKIKLLIPSKEKRQDGKGRKIISYINKEVLINKVIKNLLSGKRVLIPCNSKRLGEKIDLAIKAQMPDKKGIVINSNTSHDKNDFVMNINQQINQYDYVIYSPSLASGISIDETVTPFDLVACFIHGTVGTWFDAWQLISRYRKPTDYHIWIKDYNNTSPTDPNQIWDGYLSALRENDKELSIFQKHLFNEMAKASKEGKIHKQTDYDKLYCQREAQKNKFSKNFNANFLLIGEIRGFEITRAVEATEFHMKAIEKAHHQLRTNNLINAIDITDQEYEAMKNAPGLTELQHDQMERYAIKTFYDTEISSDLIDYDNRGKTRKEIRNLELANRDPAYLAKQDIEDQAIHTVVLNKNRMLRNKLISEALKVVRICFKPNGSIISTGDRKIDIHNKETKKFLKWVYNNRDAINALKICKTRKDLNTNPRWLFDFLRALGIKIEQKKIQGNRSYYIRVDSIKILNEHLIRRFKRFTDKYIKESSFHDLFIENNNINQSTQGALPSINYIKEKTSAPFIHDKNTVRILESKSVIKTDANWANPNLIWHQRLQDFYLNVKKGLMEEWLKIKNTNHIKWNELKCELERHLSGYQYVPDL